MANSVVADRPSNRGGHTPGRRPPVRKKRRDWGAIVFRSLLTASGAGLALFALVAAIVLGVFATDAPSRGFPERIELPFVSDAPPADLVLPVHIPATTAESSEMVAVMGPARLDDFDQGSRNAALIGTIQTEIGVTEVYRWTRFDEGPEGRLIELSCSGTVGYGRMATCLEGVPIEQETSVGWGRFSAPTSLETAYYVDVSNLPADAAWVVVTARDGSRIAAATVEDFGYVQWMAETSDVHIAESVVILDANFNTVWEATL